MHNHAPEDYKCPICLAMTGKENKDTWIKQDDIFYQDEYITGFISSKFIQDNEGHLILAPNKHFENIYELQPKIGFRMVSFGKKFAIALKKIRNCDGVNFMQFNEPAGDQHAFHYHQHIIPRFESDNFHEELWKAEKSDPKDRVKYAQDLRNYLNK